jgi:hypothetical protein
MKFSVRLSGGALSLSTVEISDMTVTEKPWALVRHR